jgi:arylsulfatase A-like enzyme
LNNRKPSKKTWLARHEGRALPDWLAAAGYRTILAGKLIGGGCPGCGRQGWNVRIDVERGPDGLHPSGRYWLDQLADDAASAIRSTPAEQPIFLWFAPASPHAPFVAKSEYRGRFRDFEPARVPSFNEEDISDKTNPEIVGRKPFSEAGIGAIVATRRTRMEMMLSVEDALRELIGVLRDTGRLDHTYIFFMSDNGFFEGEHRRPAGKGMPYEEAIEVPLFVLGPDVPRDVSASLVYNHDLTATIADLASLSPPPLDGRSLAPLWRGKTIVWRKRVLLEHYNRSLQRAWVGVRTPTRKAIIYRVGRDASEVYDLVSDPLELTNIASRSAARALLGRHLEALLSCSGDGCWAAETAPD